jgi:hypothetical protein
MTPAKTSSPKSPVTSLEVLNTKRTNDIPKAPHTFAQAAAQPPSPADLTSTEVAIASATAEFTVTVRKYQDDFRSLLKSAAPGLVPDSKIKRVRADNVALMTSATIKVQQAGGTRFSLKTLYKIARLEEKEARLYTDKVLAHNSTSTNAKEMATMMSSITDSDGYTTVTRCGRSPISSPPKPQLQSGSKMGNRKNLFGNSFLNTFLPTFAAGPARTHAPVDAVPTAIAQQPTSGGEGKMKEISTRSTVISEVDKGGQIYEEPGQRGSSAKGLLVLSSTSSSFQVDLDAYVNDPDSCQLSKKALCADQMLLITAAHSSSFSASPKWVSIYNNKQTAILSPAKGGMAIPHFHGTDKPKSHPTSRMTPTSIEFRTALDKALGHQEAQWEAKNPLGRK